ncbi:MAG: tRNA (adenosine(37)-N6)-dimethylallyltransferase MiaA [Bryobacteraceae bacterium]
MSRECPLVAIVGPTGTGKSSLALHIARVFSGEIVNCDSLQLFRGFDVGTAKLPESERRGIPHHLIDILAPGDVFSAGEYARRARDTVREISSRDRLPVIVGGTGFYLNAALNGLPSLPEREEALRVRLLERERKRPGSLRRLLSRLDPTAADRIHARDIPKLIRALEIRLLTGRTAPPPGTAEPLRGFRTFKIGLNPDRALLHAALDARTREMFHAGLIDEVKNSLESGCTGEEKPFASLGYKQALAFLRGSVSLGQAIASTQLETRQYAKRQLTWFRRDPAVVWITGFGQSARIVSECLKLVAEFLHATG